MSTIAAKLQDSRITNSFIRSVVVDIIRSHEDIITTLNKAQLEQGETMLEEKISPEYYSMVYALEKNQMNPKSGMFTPDLLYTGSFYGGFFLRVSGDVFSISSTDSKTGDLELKYGKDIFGMSSSSLEIYTEKYFLPELKKFIETNLKLRFI